MKRQKYTSEQYALFKTVYEIYRAKEYPDLKCLAEKKFNDTVHPRNDVQIGIDVFYDDKKSGDVRCSVALYIVKTQPWWHFWDSAVLVEDFIVAPDGTLQVNDIRLRDLVD